MLFQSYLEQLWAFKLQQCKEDHMWKFCVLWNRPHLSSFVLTRLIKLTWEGKLFRKKYEYKRIQTECWYCTTCTSVLSAIHLAMASAEKPILCMSNVSPCFGLPLGGKCMKTGAVFTRSWNTWNKNLFYKEHYSVILYCPLYLALKRNMSKVFFPSCKNVHHKLFKHLITGVLISLIAIITKISTWKIRVDLNNKVFSFVENSYSCMTTHHLENVWSFIKINHSKENFGWIQFSIIEWSSDNLEFIISMSERNEMVKLYCTESLLHWLCWC